MDVIRGVSTAVVHTRADARHSPHLPLRDAYSAYKCIYLIEYIYACVHTYTQTYILYTIHILLVLHKII